MSKFEELCEGLRRVKREFQAYQDDCTAFLVNWYMGLKQYMGAPEGYISYYATLGPYAGKKVMGLSSALQLGDDTYWHFGLAFDLFEEQGAFPTELVLFEILIKKADDKYEMKFLDGPSYLFGKEETAAFEVSYEFLFQDITAKFRDPLGDFLRTGDRKARRGF